MFFLFSGIKYIGISIYLDPLKFAAYVGQLNSACQFVMNDPWITTTYQQRSLFLGPEGGRYC